MKGACRIGDHCSAGADAIEGSYTVYINNKSSHRVGDKWAAFSIGLFRYASIITVQGSSTVFVNNKGKARVGDPLAIRRVKIVQGSENVFVGG